MKKLATLFLLLCVSVFGTTVASAQSADPFDALGDEKYIGSIADMQNFINSLPGIFKRTTSDGRYQALAFSLWIFFSTIMLTMTIWRWSVGGERIDGLVSNFFMITIVYLLMESYGFLMVIAFTFMHEFGFLLQSIVLGTEDAQNHILIGELLEFNSKVRLDAFPSSIAEVLYYLENVLSILLLLALVTIATVVNIAAAIAAYVFFTIVALFGLLVLPTLLFDHLKFLFDAWIRTLFTVLFFMVIIKVVSAITVLGLRVFLDGSDGGVSLALASNPLLNVPGLIIFLLVCVYMLWNAKDLAQALTTGVGVLGRGGNPVSQAG